VGFIGLRINNFFGSNFALPTLQTLAPPRLQKGYTFFAMAIIERYTSPDALMELLVYSTAGDLTISFSGYNWHTHGNILNAWGYEGSPEASTRAFVEDILQSRRGIAVVRLDGKVSEIIVPDDLLDRPLCESFAKYTQPNEMTEFRYWNGQPAVE